MKFNKSRKEEGKENKNLKPLDERENDDFRKTGSAKC